MKPIHSSLPSPRRGRGVGGEGANHSSLPSPRRGRGVGGEGANRSRAALALCCCLAMTAPVLGQTVVAGPQGKSETRKVVVTANATTYVKPNAARLSFVVTSQTQANIREDNDQQVAKMKKGIADLALASLQIQVVPSSINTLQVTERRIGVGGAGGLAGGGPGGAGVGGIARAGRLCPCRPNRSRRCSS